MFGVRTKRTKGTNETPCSLNKGTDFFVVVCPHTHNAGIAFAIKCVSHFDLIVTHFNTL